MKSWFGKLKIVHLGLVFFVALLVFVTTPDIIHFQKIIKSTQQSERQQVDMFVALIKPLAVRAAIGGHDYLHIALESVMPRKGIVGVAVYDNEQNLAYQYPGSDFTGSHIIIEKYPLYPAPLAPYKNQASDSEKNRISTGELAIAINTETLYAFHVTDLIQSLLIRAFTVTMIVLCMILILYLKVIKPLRKLGRTLTSATKDTAKLDELVKLEAIYEYDEMGELYEHTAQLATSLKKEIRQVKHAKEDADAGYASQSATMEEIFKGLQEDSQYALDSLKIAYEQAPKNVDKTTDPLYIGYSLFETISSRLSRLPTLSRRMKHPLKFHRENIPIVELLSSISSMFDNNQNITNDCKQLYCYVDTSRIQRLIGKILKFITGEEVQKNPQLIVPRTHVRREKQEIAILDVTLCYVGDYPLCNEQDAEKFKGIWFEQEDFEAVGCMTEEEMRTISNMASQYEATISFSFAPVIQTPTVIL